jgi:hypothetical protein
MAGGERVRLVAAAGSTASPSAPRPLALRHSIAYFLSMIFRILLTGLALWIFLAAPTACAAGVLLPHGESDCHESRHGACTDDPCRIVALPDGALPSGPSVAPLESAPSGLVPVAVDHEDPVGAGACRRQAALPSAVSGRTLPLLS